jgi:UrcA family protein
MFYKIVLPMVVAVAAIGCAGGALAAPSPHPVYASETVSVRVKLADLDLANPAGAAASLRRIHQAAKEICGPDESFRPFELGRIYRACIKDTVDRAVDRLGNPMVSALNGGRQSAVLASNGR